MKFKTLLVKELKGEKNTFLIGILLLLIASLYLYTRIGVWSKPSVSLTFAFSVAFGTGIIAIVKGFSIFSKEWNNDTGHLLFSLPISGYGITFSKFLSISKILSLVSLIGFFISYIFIIMETNSNYGITPAEVLIFWWIYIIHILSLIPFSFFAYIASRCVRRFRRVLLAITYLGSFYIYTKFYKILSSVSGDSLSFSFRILINGTEESLNIYYPFFVYSLLLLLLVSYLIEKKSEV